MARPAVSKQAAARMLVERGRITPEQADSMAPGWRSPNSPVGAGKYNDKFQEALASSDVSAVTEAQERGRIAREQMLPSVNEATGILDRIDTGPLAPLAKDVSAFLGGGSLGSALNSVVPGARRILPTQSDVADAERFTQIASSMTLGKAAELKGPISEKELRFLQNMVAGLDQTEGGNRRYLAAQRWASMRQSAYANAQRAWIDKLGSPAARNAQGLNFQNYWDRWASENIPVPEFLMTGEEPPTGQRFFRPARRDPPRKAPEITIRELP